MGTVAIAGSARAEERTPEEAILEGRLLAPCCYIQTLDVHESPLATELRLEIRTRLAAHEAPDAIESDLVVRYGERVRAFPKGSDPRTGMAAFVAAALAAAAVLLALLVRRWRRRSAATTSHSLPKAPRDALDDRIDDELADLEG